MALNFLAAFQTMSLSHQLIYVPGDVRSCYHDEQQKGPTALMILGAKCMQTRDD
jgi:hypothetical protein